MTVRRVILRSDAFHRIDSTKESAAQLSLSEVESSSGSWEILVGPRGHHERLAEAPASLARGLLTSLRDTMRELAAEPRPPDEPRYIQAVQSYGMQSGSRSQHLNMELYAMPQIPHWVAEEIGGGARHLIKTRGCVWCGLAAVEEESGERLVPGGRARHRLRTGRLTLGLREHDLDLVRVARPQFDPLIFEGFELLEDGVEIPILGDVVT